MGSWTWRRSGMTGVLLPVPSSVGSVRPLKALRHAVIALSVSCLSSHVR
jgi:hypothetical protein